MVDATDELKRGRESYARRAWMDAYKSLSQADQAAPLGVEDLELFATSAYMSGRNDDHVTGLERAHHLYVDTGEVLRAVRCAFWVGINPSSTCGKVGGVRPKRQTTRGASLA